MAAIVAENLTRRFGDFTAVDAVNLRVEPGEVDDRQDAAPLDVQLARLLPLAPDDERAAKPERRLVVGRRTRQAPDEVGIRRGRSQDLHERRHDREPAAAVAEIERDRGADVALR